MQNNKALALIVQELRLKYPLDDLLEYIGLSRSTYYYNIRQHEDKYADLKESISSVFYENKGRYGYRRIHAALCTDGIKRNPKLIRRLMRDLGLKGITNSKRRKYSSYKGEVGRIARNHLRRKFSSDAPYKKMVTDVTEFKTREGKLYLSPIIDLYNLEVISFEISSSPSFNLVKKMISDAVAIVPAGSNPIVHSDQGWQYQMQEYQEILNNSGFVQSMSRKGNCLDNAVAEGFFSILKREMYYGHEKEFCTNDQLEEAIRDYIYYYNNKRIKLRLDGHSPVEYRIIHSRSG